MRWAEIVESASDWMGSEELLKLFPQFGETRDLEKSIKWFTGTSMAESQFRIKQESIEVFRSQAEEMLATYDELQKDKSRTFQIVKKLKHGEKPLPVFVEYEDRQNFIIEGRHRIVAFLQLGYKFVTVVEVKAR